jgi:rhomboid protease GluP
MFQSELSFKGVTNWATIILFSINIGIFLLALAIQSMPVTDQAAYVLGGSFIEAIVSGQLWRLVTANFLQIGFLHLAMNMVGLYYYGNFIENYYGSRKLIIIYFITGVAGTLLSLLYPNSITFGASAAIWGFIGVMVGESVRNNVFSTGLPIDMKSQMGSILIWLFIGFTLPGVSGLGHLGGFAAGFLLGLILNTVNTFDISKTENTILNLVFYGISLSIFGSFILMFANIII